MTDSTDRLHSRAMQPERSAAPADSAEKPAVPFELPSFEAVYDEYFPYIWRSVQRLGVAVSQADDAVQEVFIVVHRKLPSFEGRSSIKTWLYGITLRVARVQRRR